MLDTFKHTGWRYSSRQLCNCVIGGVDVAHRIRVLARRSSDHLAVRLLIVLTSPHSYRCPVDRVSGLSASAPAQRAGAQRLCALAHSDVRRGAAECRLLGEQRTRPGWLQSVAIDPMYGPAVRCKSLRRVSGERSCINVSGL